MSFTRVNNLRCRWHTCSKRIGLIPRRFERTISRLLAHPMTAMLARLALVSPYLSSALFKLLDFQAAVQEAAGLGFGSPMFVATATIATQVLGSALFLTHRFCWLGAGMLAIFTAIATLIAHGFWRFEGLEQARQLATFLEHIALIGGLAIAAVLIHARRASTQRRERWPHNSNCHYRKGSRI